MLDQGYAAVTSRSVAANAGVAPTLIHYYFRTLDDLFIAVYQRRAHRNIDRLAAVLQDSEQPLWDIWEYGRDRKGMAITEEFIALANHRKGIRSEIAQTAEGLRQMQLDAVSDILGRYDLDLEVVTPLALLFVLQALPRVMMIEQTLGISSAHRDVIAMVEHHLTALEGPRASSGSRPRHPKR